MTTTLRARTVALADLPPPDLDRWADLVDRAADPNPFLSPAYLATAHRHLPAARDVRLVLVEDATRLLALVPLSVVPRFRGTPLPLATTAGPFLGSDSPLCVPLVDADEARAATAAVVDHLRSRRSGLPGLVELTLVPRHGPFWAALEAACRARRVPLVERYRFERAVLDATVPSPAPRAALATSARRNLNRVQRRLEEEYGPLVFSDRGADPAALEDFARLEAAGWKGRSERGGGALQVVPGAWEWFSEVGARLRERGALHVFSLMAGDELLYMSVNLRAGRHLCGLMDAYDERFARFGPGVLGRVMEQEHLLRADDVDLVDSCVHPKDEASTRLYRDRRTLAGCLLAPRGVLPRSLVGGAPLARSVAARAQGLVRDRGRLRP
ncbi:GNAT family N-acetyltransferase [Puerhibacterium sp. TATVAM-FAB25]|uniref:GNAT family N-acetyltransferase n=1 Tax=Puerhibacterium sp. TATVAM-FAB25 TaxID=3093699 RepID=UPI00397B877D